LSLFGKCPCSGSVPVREVSLFGKCPCSGSVPVREVSLFGKCHCSGSVIVREVSLFGKCRSTKSTQRLNHIQRKWIPPCKYSLSYSKSIDSRIAHMDKQAVLIGAKLSFPLIVIKKHQFIKLSGYTVSRIHNCL
jgi:hypothetical protein